MSKLLLSITPRIFSSKAQIHCVFYKNEFIFKMFSQLQTLKRKALAPMETASFIGRLRFQNLPRKIQCTAGLAPKKKNFNSYVYCLTSIVYCLMSIVLCLLSYVYCLLSYVSFQIFLKPLILLPQHM
jgi:hypothetical protein